MTRQRLRESSVKWNMILSLDSFALKIIKKSEELAFSNKAKILNVYVPLKVKKFVEDNLLKEINHFKKKYKLEFNILQDNNLVIPEYKIDLLNKNKKIIKKIENIEKNFIKLNRNKRIFSNNNFRKKNNFKKKYNFRNKTKKNNFENKKFVSY